MIKAYRKQKKSNPELSDREIFRAITKWRFGTTGKKLDSGAIGTAVRFETLRDYLKFIVIYERIPESLGSENIMREVIDEICNEEGLD